MQTQKQTINFELVSPEARLMSGPVTMAVIPAEQGEMGVGAGHASYVVALKAGVVRLFENDNKSPRKIFIAGGFADVTGENCAVLAEEAINVESLDATVIDKKIKDLKEDMTLAQEPADKSRIARALALETAKLYAVKDTRP